MDRKINITLNIPKGELLAFERWIRNNTDVIDFKILHDTEHLKDDPTFKKLLRAKYEAVNKLNDFINDNYYK